METFRLPAELAEITFEYDDDGGIDFEPLGKFMSAEEQADLGPISYGFPTGLFVAEFAISIGLIPIALRRPAWWTWAVVALGLLMTIYALYPRLSGASALKIGDSEVEFWRFCRTRGRLQWSEVQDIELVPANRIVPYPRIYFTLTKPRSSAFKGLGSSVYVGGSVIDGNIDEAYREMQVRWGAARQT